MKRGKKGFTIVELLVVIAIIAILAMVSIVGYTAFTKKAAMSNDEAVITQMNGILKGYEALDDKAKYPHQAVLQCIDNGFIYQNLKPQSKNHVILYDSVANRFCLYSEDDKKIVFKDELTIDDQADVNFFECVDASKAKPEPLPAHSIYLFSINEDLTIDDSWQSITVNTGIDTGKVNGVKSISYENNDANAQEQNIIIHTNTLEAVLTINGPQDTVSHFGYAAKVVVEHIKASSYDEYGTVGRVEVKDGHVEAMDGCEVFCLMEESTSVTATTVNAGATVHTNMVNINAEKGVAKDTATGVANGHVDDCGPGRHTFSQYVVDTQHVYDVCTCCGYTLIHVMDESGTEIKQTQNTLDANGDVVENGEVVTPVETYLTTATIPTKTVEGKKVVDVDNLPKTNLNTSGNNGKPIEESPIVDDKDDDGKDIHIDRKCTHVFAYSDYLHDTDDICLGTCTKCNLKIHTQHDWWVKTQLPGQTEYAGICSKCGCVRDTSVAQIVGGAKYKTLPEAFAAVHNGSVKTVTIKMLSDEKYEIVSSAVTVLAGEKITIDLNGHTLSGYANQKATSSMITNNGELIIKDSGTNGKLISTINGADGNDYPAYACGTISNAGKFTLESGILESKSSGGCAYVIDTSYGATSIDINGGKVIATGNDAVIRLYGYNITFNFNGGEIISNNCSDAAIFLQAGATITTNFNGGVLTNNGGRACVGIGQVITDFSGWTINFNGTKFENGLIYFRSLGNGYKVLDFPAEGSQYYPRITVSDVYTKTVVATNDPSVSAWHACSYFWKLDK